jgi:hypothetical protein
MKRAQTLEGLDINVFSADTQALFAIDDLELKAKALQLEVLPKLEAIASQAALLAQTVYGFDIFEYSKLSRTPNFRTNYQRTRQILDYNSAGCGLGGIWKNGIWKGVSRKNGRPVQILPFLYRFYLDAEGLQFQFYPNWLTGMANETWVKYLKILRANGDAISGLMLRTGCRFSPMRIDPEHGFKETFDDYLKEIMQNDPADYWIDSRSIGYPVSKHQVANLIVDWVFLYPLYQAFIDLSLGKRSRFNSMLSSLREWYLADGNDEFCAQFEAKSDAIAPSASQLAQIADAPKVIPSKRWRVFARDGFKCRCGRSAKDGTTLHVDHVQPRSRGGSDDITNLQTLCWECNLGKSNRLETEWEE